MTRQRDANPLSRRTWIEWMGQATVLSLGSLMLGCGSDSESSAEAPGSGGAGGTGAGGAGGTGGGQPSDAGPVDAPLEISCDGGTPEAFPFQPPADQGPPFDEWPVRTIDTQKLEDIL